MASRRDEQGRAGIAQRCGSAGLLRAAQALPVRFEATSAPAGTTRCRIGRQASGSATVHGAYPVLWRRFRPQGGRPGTRCRLRRAARLRRQASCRSSFKPDRLPRLARKWLSPKLTAGGWPDAWPPDLSAELIRDRWLPVATPACGGRKLTSPCGRSQKETLGRRLARNRDRCQLNRTFGRVPAESGGWPKRNAGPCRFATPDGHKIFDFAP